MYKRQELWLGVEDNGTVTGLFKPEKGEEQIKGAIATNTNPTPVSYTHLDVYKRQGKRAIADGRLEAKELRGIIAELYVCVSDELEAIADLRATERMLAGKQ